MSYEPFVGELDKPNVSGGFQEFDGELDQPSYNPAKDSQAASMADDKPAEDQQVVTSARAWNGAGGGRGGYADPRRLDVNGGYQKLSRENAVAKAVEKLRAINPQATDEQLTGMADSAYNPATDSVEIGRDVGQNTQGYMDKVRSDALYQQGLDRIKEQANQNPISSALGSGLISAATGIVNAPQALVNAPLEVVDRIGGAIAGEKINTPKLPKWWFTKEAADVAGAATPDVAGKELDQAWKDGDFGAMVAANLAQNAPSSGLSVAAMFFPPLRAAILPTMGAMTTGQEYSQGNSAVGSVLKGGMEIVGESLPLHGFDAVRDAVNKLPLPQKQQVAAIVTRKIAQAGAEVSTTAVTNFIEEAVTQLGQNAVDKYVENKNISLKDGVLKAGVIGAAAGTAHSAPALVGRALEPGSKDAVLERALAEQLDGGTFSDATTNRMVADRLRTERGNSNLIAPEATVTSFADPNGPASQAGITPIVIPNVSTPSNTGGLADGAGNGGSPVTVPSVGDMGTVGDSERGMGSVAGAPVAASATDPSVSQPSSEPSTYLNPVKRTADGDLLSRVPTSETPATIWTGRSGSGYDTVESAQQAMESRVRKDPELSWKVEQRPDGKYHLAGYAQQENAQPTIAKPEADQSSFATQEAAVAQQQREGIADTTEVVDTAQLGGDGFAIAPQAQKETVDELRTQSKAVERLASAIGASGESGAGNIELATDNAYPASSPQGRARGLVKKFSAVASAAFGVKPVAVTGLNGYGVAHAGNVFIDVDSIAQDEGKRNSLVALAIGTIGHEVGHSGLEQSKDPQDKKAYLDLRLAIQEHLNDGVIEKQQAKENAIAAASGGAKVSREYAHNEVIQNINGAMWLDTKFWARLYDIDPSSMRRVAYRFMQAATKFINAAKGSDLDINTMVKNVDAVREIVAKTWAEKAMRQGKPVSRSEINKALSEEPQMAYKSKEPVGQSNFEVAPDPNDKDLSLKWNAQTAARKLEISEKIAESIVPKVLELSGAEGEITAQVGSYLNDTNPSFALQLTSGYLHETSKNLGFVFSQDSMMNLSQSPFDGGDKVGAVTIDLGEKSAQEIKDIYDQIRTSVPEVGGQSYANGHMTVLNYSDTSTEDLHLKIDAALGGEYDVWYGDVYSSFPEKKDYDYGSERTNESGDEGQGVREGLNRLRAEASAAISRELGIAYKRRGGRQENGRASDSEVQTPERSASAKQGRLDPLPGATGVDGFRGPDPRLVSVAESYAKFAGINLVRQSEYVEVDEDRAKRIATAYAEMQHAPNNPKVKEAYSNLVKQTRAQYRALEKAGYKFWFIDLSREDNQEYVSTPWNAMRDIRANKEMGVFPTSEGFGSNDKFDPLENPLLEDTGIRWPVGGPNGKLAKVYANDLFRAVHDAFGHGLEGAGFRARGEENAWQAHIRLFTGSAIGAITSETRGQNSWLNYGPHGESNRTAKVEDTVFADQKTGLMPEWTWTEGVAGDMPSFKRRDVEDYNDIGNINELGAFDLDRKYADSTEDGLLSFPDLSAADAKLDAAQPTEAEMAERLRAEREDAKKFKKLLARELMDEGFSVSGTPKVASTTEKNFAEVKPAEIKSKGLMAEDAYPDLEYSTDPLDKHVERAFFVIDGTRYKATVSPGGSPKIQDGAAEKYSKGDAKGYMSGYELTGFTPEAKKDWNKRFAASADLMRRNFDLYTAVPAKARENVLAVWKAIAGKDSAFEFNRADGAKGSTVKDVAQSIADKMMEGGRYKVKIASPEYHRGTSDFSILITDTKTGAEGSADVEFWQKEREVTMHTHELDKGSGLGKPVYQIGQAFADKFNARINADGILLGVNNYRRTEQMFSGMLRSGNYETMQPGIGQRIYGWNERAKNQDQQDRNMVRTALAMARNVLEFAPKMERIGFDLEKNSFYFRDKPDTAENRLMAGVEIKRILSDNDARVASISRSTLARAAITLEAMDGKVDVPESIAAPVLYKRKDVPENPKLKKWAEDLMAGRRADPGFVVAPEPHKALQMFGVGRSAPVALQESMIRHLNNKGRSNDGITPDDIARIPVLLEDPRAVIERVTIDKKTGLTKREYAMILDDENEDGNPMLIALTPAQLKMGQKSIGITDIRTMYGKDDSLRYVLQSIADGQRIWMPEKEIARVRDFTDEGLIPYGTDGAAPPQTQKGPLTKQVSQAIPSNVFGPKALVKSGQGGKDWQLLKEAVSVTPDDVKRAEGIAFKRKGYPAAQGLPEETKLQSVQRVMQDQYNRIKLVQDVLVESGGTVGEEQDVYRAEERMHGRVHELMRQFADKAVHPMLEKAVKYKIDLDELALYAYAKHAKERNAHIQGMNKQVQTGSGMSDAEADNIIQLVELSNDAAKFEELHQDLMGMTAATRRVMLDEGLITQDQYDGLEKQYESYVPLRGFADQDEDNGKVRPGLGRGFNIKGAETIKAMGRDSKAGDIIENIIRDHERATIRAERNAVGKTFLDLVTTNPDPKLWEVQPLKRAPRMADGQVRYQTVEDKGDDTISVKVAGEQVYVKIHDQLLLRAMQNAFKGEKSESERFVMRAAGMYTSLLRNTITRFNPVFGVINAIRDSQMGAAGVFDALGAEGLKLYAKHYPSAVAAGFRTEIGKSDPQRKLMDKWMEEMRFAGGTTGGVFMRDNETIQSELRDAMLAAGASPKGVIDWAKHNTGTRAIKHVLHGLEMIGATSEHAARLSAYAAAREMGKTPAQAATISKNLTVNFNRFGEQGQLINTLFLFYNASVQGSVRIAQMMKNPKIRMAMAGATAAGIGLAMMAASVGGDDEDGQPYWDKIPDFEKERNLIIMLPPGSDQGEKVGTHGRYIKVPMAYGLNVFPVLGYQIADLIRYAKDPAKGVSPAKGAINLLSAVLGSYNPMGGALNPTDPIQLGLAVAPTIADPFIQLAAGVDGFGKPTGPSKSPYDQRPDSETVSAQQHGSVYHRISRWVNEATGGNQARAGAIDVQPGTVKNLGGIIGGGLGRFISDSINLGYLGATDAPIAERDIPVVKQLYGEYDRKAGMSMYYDRSKKALDEFKDAKEEFKAGIKRERADEDKFLFAMGDYAESISKAMGELKKYEIQISESNKTAKEKDIARRELQKAREKYAESFNRVWYEKESELKRKERVAN